MSFLWNIGIALAEGSPCDRGHAVDKLGLKEDVGVREHAVLQGHHHKLQGGNVKAVTLEFLIYSYVSVF